MELISFLILCAWVIVVVWNIRWATIILPAFFPLYLIKFKIGFVPFNVVEVMVYLVFAIFLCRVLCERFLKKSDYEKLGEKFLRGRVLRFAIPVVGLVLGSLGGLYMAYLRGDIVSALGIFKGWVVMPILYSILVISVLKTVRDKKLTFYFYMLSVFGLSLWAFWQAISGEYITIDQRASGPFESANYLALYIGSCVILSGVLLWQRIEQRFTGNKLLGWIKGVSCDDFDAGKIFSFWAIFEFVVFVSSFLALILSRSYGGIIAVFAAFSFYVVYELFFSNFKEKYGRFWIKFFVFFGVVLLAVLTVYSQLNTNKFKDFLAFNQQSSSSVRIQVWTTAATFIEENPVLGIGLGRFERLYGERAGEILGVTPYEKTMLQPHNLILSTWLNAGLIGVVSIIWLAVAVFLSLRREEISLDEKRFMFIVVLMFIVICVHGVVDQPFWKNDLALIWWMIVGSVI
jgi:O-antigen ligase